MAKKPVTFQDYLNEIENPDFALILQSDFNGDVDAARTAYFVELFMKKKIENINKILENINFTLHDPQGTLQQVNFSLNDPNGVMHQINNKLDTVIKNQTADD